MTVFYIVVAIVFLVIGFIGMCAFMVEEQVLDDGPLIFIRVVALFTLGSWVVAILWPVLLALVVPALMVYGVVVAFKAYKARDLDY